MKIAVTERGDLCFDSTWDQKLRTGFYDGAILITKNANTEVQNKILSLYQSGYTHLILHLTCTGWGGTVVEPHVPSYNVQINNLIHLVQNGFPLNQIVLRIDPIFPNKTDILQAKRVLSHPAIQELNRNFPGSLRVRISILDLYPHVKERFRSANLSLPMSGFYPTQEELQSVANLLSEHPAYQYETCAEDYLARFIQIRYPQIQMHIRGCVSAEDLHRMGLPQPTDTHTGFQRKGCHCLSCKTELLSNKHRCPAGCLYCYWKDR